MHAPPQISVLTAIIKWGLRTLLECVRLQAFTSYGPQQMQVEEVLLLGVLTSSQVDCHYL